MKSGRNLKQIKLEKRVTYLVASNAAEVVSSSAPLFPEIIATWNDGQICLTETGGARLLGARRPALLSDRPFLHFVPPEGRAGVRKWMKQLGRLRRPIRHEISLRRFDGSVIAIATLAIASTRNGQAVVEVYGWDITSRKRAEMKLADLASVVESSNDAIYSRSLDGTITSWNKAAERIFGYSEDEIVGRSSSVIEPPQRSGEFARIASRLRAGEPVEHFETERQRKDGSVIQVSLTVSSVFDASGELTGFSTIARDITTQQQALEKLRRSERELADLFDYAPLGLLWVNPAGAIERINKTTQDLLEWRVARPDRVNLRAFFVSKHVFEDLMACLANRETVRNVQTRWRTRRGTVRTVLIHANGLWENERFVLTRWFVRDITARKQMEREILNISERERQRLARELHDGLGQYLSGAAYLANSLREELAEKGARETAAAERVTKLIEDSIQLARDLAHGMLPVRPEPAGLIDALQELADRSESMFKIACRFTCPRQVHLQDETLATHLYRIAQESVHNALQHGKATRVDIELTRNGRHLILAIRDNGIGIGQLSPHRKGRGLRIMQYRASLIQGTLSVQKLGQRGTEVVCTVDLGEVERSDLSANQARMAGEIET